MESTVKSLVSNTGALFVLQITGYLLPLIMLPYLAHILGVELFGIVAFGFSLMQVAYVITDFGFNLSSTRYIAANTHSDKKINLHISAVYVCKLFLVIIVAITFFIFLEANARFKNHQVYYYLLLIPIVGQALQPLWYFQGIQRMGYITLYMTIARSLSLLLIILLVKKPEDYFWVALALGAGQITAALVGIAMMRRLGGGFIWPGLKRSRVIFMHSAQFFLARAAVSAYTAGATFFLGFSSTPAQVAYYSAAEQLYRGCQSLLQPLSQALYPYMTKTKNLKLFVRVLLIALMATTLGVLIAWFIGADIVRILFGEGFAQSTLILKFFLIALIFNVPAVLLGYPFLGALGDTRSANLSVIFAGVVQVVLLVALYFTDHAKALTVVQCVVLVEFIVLAYRMIKAIPHLKNSRLDTSR